MHRIFTNFVENAEHPVKRSTLVARAAAFAAIILPKKLVGWFAIRRTLRQRGSSLSRITSLT
jgi:hypothetical protein